jgi:hypothetical protein
VADRELIRDRRTTNQPSLIGTTVAMSALFQTFRRSEMRRAKSGFEVAENSKKL